VIRTRFDPGVVEALLSLKWWRMTNRQLAALSPEFTRDGGWTIEAVNLLPIGADQVIDYRAGPILKSLAAAASEGIDVYFDNVGGDHLDAAFALARNNARFAICGMIDSYNSAEPTKLRFIQRIIAARIRLKGFIVFDYQSRMSEFYGEMGPWVANGTVKATETVVDDLENMPDAFLGLFTGANTGKMLVRL
jgi:NADPH-dependent curcumin reductase CurA